VLRPTRSFAHAVVETLRISAPTVLEAVLGRGAPHEVYDERLRSWSKKLIDHAGARVSVSGLENLGDTSDQHGREVFVVMSNHQSVYDIPVLFHALPIQLRMVAKQELFRIPIWGRAMRYSGFVAIDRSNRQRAIASLSLAKQKMRDEGVNIWIAPEGTRSRHGTLGDFKSGGFHLALDTGLRILPVSLVGTFDILRADTSIIRRGADVHVVVHAPIDPNMYGHERRAELIAEVRRVIAGPLGDRS
jgi:1-acyl-sn-glycerol-3-phosphate acyltransferase